MIVLDTNALIRWISDPEKLSQRAKKTIGAAEKKKAIYISSISVLEIYTLVKKNKLKFNILADNWLEKVESLPYVNFVSMDNKIAVQSVNLPDPLHKDPADRIIIATALQIGAKLITSDQKILDYPYIQAVW